MNGSFSNGKAPTIETSLFSGELIEFAHAILWSILAAFADLCAAVGSEWK